MAAVAVLLGLIAIAAASGWFWYAVYRNRSLPASETRVVVPQGTTFAAIARQLAELGVIDNVLAFRLMARMRGQESEVRAGEYRFAHTRRRTRCCARSSAAALRSPSG